MLSSSSLTSSYIKGTMRWIRREGKKEKEGVGKRKGVNE